MNHMQILYPIVILFTLNLSYLLNLNINRLPISYRKYLDGHAQLSKSADQIKQLLMEQSEQGLSVSHSSRSI